VNECTSKILKHGCDKNAKCANTAGSYTCECNKIYFGGGKACKKGKSNEIFPKLSLIISFTVKK
jgi:hypothetical protein